MMKGVTHPSGLQPKGLQVKHSTPIIRASHVNTGTSILPQELPWPDTPGRVLHLPPVQLEVDRRSEVTPYGGLALVVAFVRRFKVAQILDRAVHVLKQPKPYHESDHILTQAFSLYVGGTCLEDLSALQHSKAVQRLVGACRLPDPTTAGDFLRRFSELLNPGSLAALRGAIDTVQDAVWQQMAKRRGRKRRKQPWALVDLDGHIKELYGVQKGGADFSYTGKWSYHPLVVSLAGSGECLAVRNRPGNVRSSEGAAAVLTEVLPRVHRQARQVLVRGDSDFDRRDVRDACEAAGVYFAFVGRESSNRPALADAVPESAWQAFEPRAKRALQQRRQAGGFRRRQRRANRRRQRARDRNYKALELREQWLAEVPWQPTDSDKTYRLIIRRQRIAHYQGAEFIRDEERYRYVVTNLPPAWSAQAVVDETYQRCDQENVIAQLGSGLAAWRMPVGEFIGNCAWLEIARLAWNLAKWIAQLALPAEVVRWEWKRFRQAFVYVGAQVIKRGRQVWLRFSGSHRFSETLVAAHQCLQT